MKPKISAEVEAMLRFFAKQSEISKKDIREFSKEYNLVQEITRKHNQAGFSMIVVAALFTGFAAVWGAFLDHQTIEAPIVETAQHLDNRAAAALALSKYATDHKTLPAPVDGVIVTRTNWMGVEEDTQIIKGKLPDLSTYDANLTTKDITYSVNRNLLVASGVASERLPFDGDYTLEIKDAKPLYVRLSDTDYQLPVLHQESDGHGGWVFKADK